MPRNYSKIIDWLRDLQTALKTAPAQIYITHGEPSAADAMRIHIKESLGWHSRVPEYQETVELWL